MSENNNTYASRIEKLQKKYLEQLPEKLQDIDNSWQDYRQNSADQEKFELFYRLVHTLKGTAGTFGFHKQADACLAIQNILVDIKNGSDALNTDTANNIQSHLDTLNKNIDSPADEIPY